jgi:DNA-binding response OmpR family regulator
MGNKILIIDDEADVVTYLTALLRSNDYKPFALTDVVSAMDRVQEINPDLICLDIMMPEETGLSFYSKLRKDSEYKHIPVIIISGVIQSGNFNIQSYARDNDIPQPEGCMEKPINVKEFLRTIKRLTSRKDRAGLESNYETD